jgi:hypothetical protein
MLDLSSPWLALHWNPIWGITVYVFRMVYDLCVGRDRIGKTEKINKIKSVGPDLFWISVVVWGILLVKSDKTNILVSLIGEDFRCRLLIIAALIIIGFIITKMKTIDEVSQLQKKEGILGFRRAIKSFFLNLPINILGFGSFLAALYLMGNVT